jgi:NAD-dependent deacetylase
MKKIVVLTGAGISAESGIRTFRDSGGLWEGYNVQDVATPEAWHKDPELVLRFYNERRKNVLDAQPNAGHLGLVELEKHFNIQVITQNVDDLHERAGSSNVLHLHGELLKVRSCVEEDLVYDCTTDINMGDKCAKGHQLRPHIVWFGEAVPMMEEAVTLAYDADIFVVVGTSLVVYPAASLLHYVPRHKPVYIVDPKRPDIAASPNMHFIEKTATEGVTELISILLQHEQN